MSAPQRSVSIGHGTAYDVLLSAAAVADLRWRDTFTVGAAAYAYAHAVERAGVNSAPGRGW